MTGSSEMNRIGSAASSDARFDMDPNSGGGVLAMPSRGSEEETDYGRRKSRAIVGGGEAEGA